jgi:hypothetical protein
MDSLDYNIFVPSKNRVNNCSTILNSSGFKLNIVVEPQDYEKYFKEFNMHNIIVLPENNKGITYVRNFIKNYTEENNLHYYWQLDDDITGIFNREGTKLIKTGYINLDNARKQFELNNIALGSLEYRQFAWSASKPLIVNSFCDSCVYVNNLLTKGMRYNPYTEGKEDRDFAIQVINNGNKTGRTTLYAFSVPANGTNAGGLKETFYDIIGKESQCADHMVEVWGEHICQKIVKPTGRIDVKINWSNINKPTLF